MRAQKYIHLISTLGRLDSYDHNSTQTFTCSKSTIKTIQKGVKHVQC